MKSGEETSLERIDRAVSEWIEQEAEAIKEQFEELVKRYWEYMYLLRGKKAREGGKRFNWKYGCRYREGKLGGDLRWFEQTSNKRFPIRDVTYKKALGGAEMGVREWMRKIETEANQIRSRRKALDQINARLHGYQRIKENAATKSEMEEIVRMCEEA